MNDSFQGITLGKIHGPKPSAETGKAVFSFLKVGLYQPALKVLLERIRVALLYRNSA
jgi:hypothetical protein